MEIEEKVHFWIVSQNANMKIKTKVIVMNSYKLGVYNCQLELAETFKSYNLDETQFYPSAFKYLPNLLLLL